MTQILVVTTQHFLECIIQLL